MAEDAVSKYVARPGQHQDFMAALIDSFLRLEPYVLYELSNHQCVALVVKTDPGAHLNEADCISKEPPREVGCVPDCTACTCWRGFPRARVVSAPVARRGV